MAIIFNLSQYEINDDLREEGVIDLDNDLRDELFQRVDDATFSEVNKSIMKETLANSVVRLVAAQIKRLAVAEGDNLPEHCKIAMELDKFMSGAPSPNLCRFYGARVMLGDQWPWLNSALEKEFSKLGIAVGYPFYRDIGDEYTVFKGIAWV